MFVVAGRQPLVFANATGERVMAGVEATVAEVEAETAHELFSETPLRIDGKSPPRWRGRGFAMLRLDDFADETVQEVRQFVENRLDFGGPGAWVVDVQ